MKLSNEYFTIELRYETYCWEIRTTEQTDYGLNEEVYECAPDVMKSNAVLVYNGMKNDLIKKHYPKLDWSGEEIRPAIIKTNSGA